MLHENINAVHAVTLCQEERGTMRYLGNKAYLLDDLSYFSPSLVSTQFTSRNQASTRDRYLIGNNYFRHWRVCNVCTLIPAHNNYVRLV